MMKSRDNNKVLKDSKIYAIRIIKFYQYLVEVRKEFILSKQVLRSGTSMGANIRESINAQSTLDFISKLNIALKEADETEYWLELLYETDFINKEQFQSLYNDCGRIAATLTNIILTTKKNNKLT
ncbi:MAG: four helix bundle protein [Bacteroidaceae bacterium]|nr:four helix bundle protein [Bacteroidaceae bacterium]